jgi:uncharacterized protein (TIGR02646 family)
MTRTRRRPVASTGLIRQRQVWSARWIDIHAGRKTGEWATRRAREILKVPILELTCGKCVFCESPLEVQAFAQVEHYVARTVAPDLAFEWTNLLPVCPVCNTRKGGTDHQGSLLKPDDEDPEPFFWLGPQGELEADPRLSPSDAVRAVETIRICDLNRIGLRRFRAWVATIVRQWLLHPDEQEWAELSDPGFPYKFVVRHVLTSAQRADLAAFDRTRFHQ